jgi:hypothetical protein
MNNPNRMISFFGLKPPRSIQRAVQTQIDKWIERKKNLLTLPNKECSYQVRFEQDEAGFFCHVHIQIGTCTWDSNDLGKSVQEALFRALKHPSISFVHPKTQIQYLSPASETKCVA